MDLKSQRLGGKAIGVEAEGREGQRNKGKDCRIREKGERVLYSVQGVISIFISLSLNIWLKRGEQLIFEIKDMNNHEVHNNSCFFGRYTVRQLKLS